ncbi:MAG: CHAT domain-containing protein [Acidobacteria bacterium]|nr:CHAT domain-containing protein [Acidobacteriota bacterium]
MRSSLLFRRRNPGLHRAVRRAPLLLAALLCGAETAPTAKPFLHDGFTQEREIRGGEKQAYAVELQAGQFLRVTVQENGVDVEVRLLDPKGVLVVVADSLNLGRPDSTEDLAAVAERPGAHRIEVTAAKRQSGRYTLRVEGPRAPNDVDRTRAEAVKATSGGMVEPVESDGEKIRLLERSAVLWQEIHESRKAAQALYVLGQRHHELGKEVQAAQDYQGAAASWASQPDRKARHGEALALNWAGLCLKEAERRSEARQLYERARAIAREIGDEWVLASALSNLGLLDSDEGETHKGIELQEQALELTKRVGDPEQEGKILSNLAYAYKQVSENQKAVKLYKQTLELARSTSDRPLEALAENGLADLSSTLGDFEKSLSQYQAALALSRASRKRTDEARTLNNIGTVDQHLERFDESQRAYEQALALARKVNDQETQTQILLNQSSLALRLGQPAQALKLAQQALPLAHGYRDREADAHFTLGRVYRALQDRPAARRELELAVALDRQLGDLPAEADVTLALARLDRDAGDLPAALSQVSKALEIIESLRTRVVDQGLRTSFSAARQDYYELQIELLMGLHERRRTEGFAADALKASEGARARTLLEVLKESEADIREGADPALVERERRLREEVNDREWLRVRLLAREKPDPAKLAEAGQRVEEALDEYQRVQASLRESGPRYAALTQPQPLGVAGIQAELLDGQALLLEYSLGAERSFLWVVAPHSLDAFPLPGRDVIERTARRYYELLTVRNARKPGEPLPAFKARIAAADAGAEQAGRELSQMILQPAAKLLGDQPLLVVADGALQYIPFAALPIPGSGEPLETRHEIITLPSATALAALRRELGEHAPARRELAIFADPVYKDDQRLKLPKASLGKRAPASRSLRRGARTGRDTLDVSNLRRLPFSEREAEKIAALVLPAQVFRATGFEASKLKVTGTDLKGFRKLHFATHGILDTRHPELSGLVLSLYDKQGREQNGVLRLNDIYNLRLGADLVVLSACRTALGREWRGEGLIGLTRGFMYAGAARVVASLWSVEDQATAELMEGFYRGMLRENLSPAAALRKAQLEMRRNPRRKSPFYWAGFSLQGEWR